MKKATNKRRKVGKTERAMKATMYQCVAVVDKLMGRPKAKVAQKPKRKQYVSMKQHLQEVKMAELRAENALLRQLAMEAKVVSVTNYQQPVKCESNDVYHIGQAGNVVAHANEMRSN